MGFSRLSFAWLHGCICTYQTGANPGHSHSFPRLCIVNLWALYNVLPLLTDASAPFPNPCRHSCWPASKVLSVVVMPTLCFLFPTSRGRPVSPTPTAGFRITIDSFYSLKVCNLTFALTSLFYKLRLGIEATFSGLSSRRDGSPWLPCSLR
jgi:hypothetical protein